MNKLSEQELLQIFGGAKGSIGGYLASTSIGTATGMLKGAWNGRLAGPEGMVIGAGIWGTAGFYGSTITYLGSHN